MSECTTYAPMLTARQGELASDEARALESHLAGCAACRARKADLASTNGMVKEALYAAADGRDFSRFAEGVMARLEAKGAFAPERARAHLPLPPGEGRGEGGRRGAEPPGFLSWLTHHRLVAFTGALAPALAALALVVYLGRDHAGPAPQAGDLDVVSESHGTMVLQTNDGPVVLLGDASEPEGI